MSSPPLEDGAEEKPHISFSTSRSGNLTEDDETPKPRRESAVAFQLPEEARGPGSRTPSRSRSPVSFACPPEDEEEVPVQRSNTLPSHTRRLAPPQVGGPPTKRRASRAKSAEGATLDSDRSLPDQKETQETPAEELPPAVRKNQRLLTPDGTLRSKSQEKPVEEKTTSASRRSRTGSPCRFAATDIAQESSADVPAAVVRKTRRTRTLDKPTRKAGEESAEHAKQDEKVENLVPHSRKDRRTRTHSPPRIHEEPATKQDEEQRHHQELPAFRRKSRRHRTLSPGTRLNVETSSGDAQEESEETKAKVPASTKMKAKRMQSMVVSIARDADEASAPPQEKVSSLMRSKTAGGRSLAEAARKAVAAVDAEEREKQNTRLQVVSQQDTDRPKSARAKPTMKAAVDFVSVAAAARKARRRTTIARKEQLPLEHQEDRPPAAPRDLELIRMTFSSARRGLAMAREALALQIISPIFLFKTVIKSLGKAAIIVKKKRQAKGWKILRVFLAAKKMKDFATMQEEYNPQVKFDEMMQEHVSNIFWQFVVFELQMDEYTDILLELVKCFAEPKTGIKEDLPDLRKPLEKHLERLETDLQDRILAGDRESIDNASKRTAEMRKSLEKIMEEAGALRSLVVYSRQISRVGRTEKNTAMADAGLLDEIKKLQVSRRLLRKMKRQEKEKAALAAGQPIRKHRRRRKADADGEDRKGSKGKKGKAKADESAQLGEEGEGESSSSSDSESSYSSDEYSYSEGDESEEPTDDEQVDLPGPEDGASQDEDAERDSCRLEIVYTPVTVGGSTDCPDDTQRATPLDHGPTPSPLLTLPEEADGSDQATPHRTISGASLTLGPQWTRLTSQASTPRNSPIDRYLLQDNPDVEAKMVLQSSTEWDMVEEFFEGRSCEDYVILDRHQIVMPLFAEDWRQLSVPAAAFPITIQHKEAPLVVEFSGQWKTVIQTYMEGRDLDAYDVLDCHSTVIPLFEEVWHSSSVPSFPLTIQRKESAGFGDSSSRSVGKSRIARGRRRQGAGGFQWQEVAGLLEEAAESSSPTRTSTRDDAAIQAFDSLDEGSDSRIDAVLDDGFEWLEDSALPKKVKMHLQKFRRRPLGQVPSKMPFFFRRGRLRSTVAYAPLPSHSEAEEVECTLGSLKRVKRAQDNRLSLDQVCSLREEHCESERIQSSWLENKASAIIPPLSLKPVLGKSKVPWENSQHLANMPFGHIAKPRFARFPPNVESQSQVTPPSTPSTARRRLPGTQMIGKTRSRPWQVKDERRQVFPLVRFQNALCKVQA